MTLLITGLVLWFAAHLFKRVLPEARAAMGPRGKIVVALVLLAAVVLMVKGYRSAEVIALYEPIAGMGRLNNLLMLFAVYFVGIGSVGGQLAAKIRHPMLTGVSIWAVAHLLVNGDLASLVLFAGLLIWSFVQMGAINRSEGPWERPEAGPWSKDIKLAGITLVVYAIIAGFHIMIGYNPFLGTYG